MGDRVSGSVYGADLYTTNGNSDLKYSYDALANAVAEVKSSLQVRSWRVIK